jgi:hypothetical protein
VSEQDRVDQAKRRITSACHAMQTGVAVAMTRPSTQPSGSKETDPKHLRVGVNMALCNVAGVAAILMSKGIITEAEYYEALAVEIEKEQASYEAALGIHLG